MISLDASINLLVKVAFVALVAHFVGISQPGLVAQVPLLPWTTIMAACVSIAALFSAFHGLARSILWITVFLAVLALALGSAAIVCVIQFAPADKSERAFNAVASVGNALFALVFNKV